MKKRSFSRRHAGRLVLVLCNVALVLAVVAFVVYYTSRVNADQAAMVRDSFCDTVETMKQLSSRYLDSEKRVVEDWAAYIEHENMTMDEALAYLRVVNTDSDCSAHLVDMNTFKARSTQIYDGDDSTTVYERFASSDQYNSSFINTTMRRMFAGESHVLGRYRIPESQSTVISVGTRVWLNNGNGWKQRYLLLRIIPVESIRKIWIFPLNYANAEIGLITPGGDYVIPSNSMRSENFIEFLRAYNFADDYNGVDALLPKLQNEESGLMEYDNARGEPCYWYYSRLDGYDGQIILGYVPKKSLTVSANAGVPIVLVVSGLMLALMLIDGAHVLSINRRLRISVKLAEQASEAKTQFLSTMSHDIRTPLNAVIGMTQLAQDRMDDRAYVQDCLNKISISGSHLLTLINDILELSRVESGKTTLTPAPFAVAELADELESITRSQTDGRGQRFKVQLHDISSPYLVGDKLRLSQVYLNLLNNAVNYTGEDKLVRVTQRWTSSMFP